MLPEYHAQVFATVQMAETLSVTIVHHNQEHVANIIARSLQAFPE